MYLFDFVTKKIQSGKCHQKLIRNCILSTILFYFFLAGSLAVFLSSTFELFVEETGVLCELAT